MKRFLSAVGEFLLKLISVLVSLAMCAVLMMCAGLLCVLAVGAILWVCLENVLHFTLEPIDIEFVDENEPDFRLDAE